MEYKFYTSSGELYHWGIKGMKWGVRRYQNKDGSLTAAGKKRRAKLEGELEKLGGSSAPRKKSVSEMTNKELQEQTTRMQLEKNYYDAKRNLASANPRQVSKGQKFAEKFIEDAIIPAVSSSAKSYLESYLKKTLGIETKNELQRLEEKWKKTDYKKKISDLEKDIKDNEDTSVSDLEKKWKKLDYEKKIKDLENPESKSEKVDWDAKTKEQNFIKEQLKTAKAQQEYDTWLEEERRKRERDDD